MKALKAKMHMSSPKNMPADWRRRRVLDGYIFVRAKKTPNFVKNYGTLNISFGSLGKDGPRNNREGLVRYLYEWMVKVGAAGWAFSRSDIG